MKFPHKQRGMTVLGGAFLLLVASVSTAIGLKLLPHYMDFYSLQRVITLPSSERAVGISSARDFYRYVEKGMTINAVRNLSVGDIMNVDVSYGSIYVNLDYEVREHLIGNVDVVLSFQREYNLPQ